MTSGPLTLVLYCYLIVKDKAVVSVIAVNPLPHQVRSHTPGLGTVTSVRIFPGTCRELVVNLSVVMCYMDLDSLPESPVTITHTEWRSGCTLETLLYLSDASRGHTETEEFIYSEITNHLRNRALNCPADCKHSVDTSGTWPVLFTVASCWVMVAELVFLWYSLW